MPTQQTGTNHARELDPERWLSEHGDYLFRYAVTRIHSQAVAEDLVQETFLAGLKAKERFSGRSSERTWLTGILKHKIVDFIRKDSRERTYEDTDTLETFEKENFLPTGEWKHKPTDWWANPIRSYEQKEFWEVLQKCLAELKDQHHRAFVLREMEGLEGNEICEILDISESNLWVILHRTRLRLRSCIETNWFRPSTNRPGTGS